MYLDSRNPVRMTVALLCLCLVSVSCKGPKPGPRKSADRDAAADHDAVTASGTAGKADTRSAQSHDSVQLPDSAGTNSVDNAAARTPTETDRFEVVRKRADQHLAWARTSIEQLDRLKQEAASLEALEKTDGFEIGVPDTVDKAAVEAEWRALAQGLGIEVLSVLVSESELDVRDLPDVVVVDKPFALETGDVRRIYQVTVKITDPGMDAMALLVNGSKSLKRLNLLRRVSTEFKGVVLVHSEIYSFVKPSKPKFIAPTHRLDQEMKHAAVNFTIEEAIKRDPIGYIQSSGLAYNEYDKLMPQLTEYAEVFGKLQWLRVRRDFWNGRKAEVEAVSLARLLH